MPPAGSNTDRAIERLGEALLQEMDLPADGDVPERADVIRHFVHRHSVHRIDETFYSYWYDVPGMMAMLYRQSRHSPLAATEGQKPHMECSSRSAVMYHLLRTAGIRARFVVVLPDADPARSHTFLEVLNPSDGRWSIQDPDANAFWISADGRRAGAGDLVKYAVREAFTPCSAEAVCGFDSDLDHIATYFSMAVVIDPEADDVPILYNADRLDRRHVFHYIGLPWSYCALFGGQCNYAVVHVN